jgi:5-methylcytosine-specific restriction endonuclease McrA
MRNKTPVAGDRFGNLVILNPKEKLSNAGKWYAKVRCDCGAISSIQLGNIVNGNSARCSRLCPTRPPPYNLLPTGKAASNNRYSNYRNSAKGRGLDFELTIEQFVEVSQNPCFYCGLPPSNSARVRRKSKTGTFVYSGMDRLDSHKGYTYDNVAPCCKRCNSMKGNMSYEEFVSQVRTIYERTKHGKPIPSRIE